MTFISKSNEERDIYRIPPNFINEGSLFGGMLKLRNGIEAVILFLGISIPILKITTFSFTSKIIVLCLTALPAGIFALIGVGGESLTAFLMNFFRFLKERRIIRREAGDEIDTIQKKKEHFFMTEEFPEEFEHIPKRDTKKGRKKQQKTVDFFPVEKVENGICYLKDRRYIKIIEIEPINFLLRSAREQRNIIYSYTSYLKISPVRIQIKVISKKADINKHLDKIQKDIEREKNHKCKILLMDYYNLIRRIGLKEAVTRRFFMVLEYEPILGGSKKNEEQDAINQLNIAEHTARTYLRQCGNEVIEQENEDEFMTELFYILFNRKKSNEISFQERAKEVLAESLLKGSEGKLHNMPISAFVMPEYILLKKGSYIEIDGLYYSYFMIPSDGYKPQVIAGWLSLLVNAGEGIDVDIFLNKEPKDKAQFRLGQQIRINRSKMKETSDTNTDFDEIDSAIRSGYYLKEGLANNQDFYYMNILITITADSVEELEWRSNEMKKLMISQDLRMQLCYFRQEQAFLCLCR